MVNIKSINYTKSIVYLYFIKNCIQLCNISLFLLKKKFHCVYKCNHLNC